MNNPSIEFNLEKQLISYKDAVRFMEARVAGIISGEAKELIWLLEHPPLYTAGTSANKADLLDARFPVYETGRGGEYTYHGPGQRVAYVMLDLKKRNMMDIKKYVWNLEEVIIKTLAEFGIKGERRIGRVGIWVVNNHEVRLGNRTSHQLAERRLTGALGNATGGIKSNTSLENFSGDIKEEKIAAIGIRIKKWVTYHGIAININPDLSHFSGIVPCGIKEYGVTSFEKLGKKITMQKFDEVLMKKFEEVF